MLSALQDATWQVTAWTLAVFLAGFIFGRRDRGRRDLVRPPQMDAPPPAPPPSIRHGASSGASPPDIRTQIEAALAAGKKIEAIKLLRAATGMGLKDAKDAVEDGRF